MRMFIRTLIIMTPRADCSTSVPANDTELFTRFDRRARVRSKCRKLQLSEPCLPTSPRRTPLGHHARRMLLLCAQWVPKTEVRAHAAQNTLSEGSPINSVSQSPNEEDEEVASRFNHFITHFLCCSANVVFFGVPPSPFFNLS